MDGILLTAGNPMRDPSAYPIVMERIGVFTGDNEADDAHAASLMRRPQFVRSFAFSPSASASDSAWRRSVTGQH